MNMRFYTTGETIYEHILSVDDLNIPVTGGTFDNVLYRNGGIYNDAVLNFSLIDGSRGIYQASFSASTQGQYQIYSHNLTTGTIYTSYILTVGESTESDKNIYLGF